MALLFGTSSSYAAADYGGARDSLPTGGCAPRPYAGCSSPPPSMPPVMGAAAESLQPLGGGMPPPQAPSPCAFAAAAGGAATDGGSAQLDGKDFFRQARLRLTYEQFNQFLSNIMRLNDHAQTRDETVQRAQEIFGAENNDLFAAFKSLLSKHGLS